MQTCAFSRVRANSGYSLLEIMIGIAMLGSVVLFSVRMTQQSSNATVGRQSAEVLAAFQQLSAQYFISNRSSMMSAMVATASSDSNVQTHCAILIPTVSAVVNPGVTPGTAGTNGTLTWSSTKKTCAFDASLLQAKGQWSGLPINYQDTDMGGQWRYVAIFRRIMLAGPDAVLGTADDVPTDTADMVTIRMDVDGNLGTAMAANAWAKDQTRREVEGSARDMLGATGGVMPIGSVGWCIANKTTTQACGNGWTVNITDFLDAAQLTTLRAKLPN